jgi:hypothetical protein
MLFKVSPTVKAKKSINFYQSIQNGFPLGKQPAILPNLSIPFATAFQRSPLFTMTIYLHNDNPFAHPRALSVAALVLDTPACGLQSQLYHHLANKAFLQCRQTKPFTNVDKISQPMPS